MGKFCNRRSKITPARCPQCVWVCYLYACKEYLLASIVGLLRVGLVPLRRSLWIWTSFACHALARTAKNFITQDSWIFPPFSTAYEFCDDPNNRHDWSWNTETALCFLKSRSLTTTRWNTKHVSLCDMFNSTHGASINWWWNALWVYCNSCRGHALVDLSAFVPFLFDGVACCGDYARRREHNIPFIEVHKCVLCINSMIGGKIPNGSARRCSQNWKIASMVHDRHNWKEKISN